MAAAKKRRKDPQQQQVRAVQAALKEQDLAALQDLAYSPLGFCSQELRRTVWLFLLGLSLDGPMDGSWRRHLPGLQVDSKEARVMQADVQRSVYSWDVHTGLRKATRDQKRVQLSEVMHAILGRHNGHLGYFQGFHDIVLVFLEVGTPSQAFYMVERLALFHLSDQLCHPFDKGLLPLLSVLFQLLGFLDEPLAGALMEADCAEMHFAVPWVLTWFAHSLPRLHQQVMRLFDCFLCSHPAAVLYFCAALLIRHRDVILQTPRDMPEMVATIQGLPLDGLDADEWAALARQLMLQVPPERLLQQLPLQRRRQLPNTSPLLHYPHPWMRRGAAAASMAANGDLSQLAPVYRLPPGTAGDHDAGGGGLVGRELSRILGDLSAWRGRLVCALGFSRDRQAKAGFPGAALAMLLRAVGLGAFALSVRAWVKR